MKKPLWKRRYKIGGKKVSSFSAAAGLIGSENSDDAIGV